MNSLTAPNVGGAEVPGRRTVHSMCGMRAVRCPIEATVEDGRMTWLQDNPHDKAIGTFVRALSSPKTPAHHGFVRDRPPDHKTAHLDRELCPSCTRQRAEHPTISAIARPR